MEENGVQRRYDTAALRILEACPGIDASERYLNEEKMSILLVNL